MKSVSRMLVSDMDTAKDARVLVLEDALRRLNEIVGHRKLRFHVDYSLLSKLVQTAGGLIYEVKFSYLDAGPLGDLEATDKIVSTIKEFEESYRSALKSTGYRPESAKDTHTLAEIDYCFRIVNGFQKKLRERIDDPAFAVDILAVEITQTSRIEDSKNLTECRCTDGSRIWRILTNIEGLTTGARLVCAVLPPVEMMGVVSEAMFLGGENLTGSIELGLLTDPQQPTLDQARAQVLQIIKRMT